MSTHDRRRVLLLGGVSQTGFALLRRYGRRALTPCCSVRSRHPGSAFWVRVDLDDPDGLRRVLAVERPSLVIHCGGICDVARCEAQPSFAWTINVDSVRTLLDSLEPTVRLVYCSSDHVFGGDLGPYRESDPHHPISVYGRTRSAAESRIAAERPAALIVRHGLGIGPSPSGRNGHLDWLRYRTRGGLPTTVVADEVRSAVWADELAGRVWELAHTKLSGTRHVVATRAVSRVELARYLDARFGIRARLRVATRGEQAAPHIGNVELATVHADRLAAPLPSVVPGAGDR